MRPSGAFLVATFLLLSSAAIVRGADPTGVRRLAFASQNRLAATIGKYDPKIGWVQGTAFYDPPQPGDPVTLFGPLGKAGEIPIQDTRRADPSWIPIEWSAFIKRSALSDVPYALAVVGSWPEDPAPAVKRPLDDPALVQAASVYLKKKHLDVLSPYLTEAYQVDLDADGSPESLFCIHSDRQAMRDDAPADIYAAALLVPGKSGAEAPIALVSQTSHKPASQTREDHERFHGVRDFYRYIAFWDIDGDGKKEIVIYMARDGASDIRVFTFDGRTAHQVLSAYKAHYQ